MNCIFCNKVFKNNREKSKHLNNLEKYCFNKHKIITYNDNKYVIIEINSKNETYYSVFDYNDLEKLKFHWNIMNNGYACTENNRQMILLHRLLFEEELKENDTNTPDHINRIRLDNRRKNLRLASKTTQMHNQKKKIRKQTYPELEKEGITHDDLPRGVWYSKGDKRFMFGFKKNHIRKRIFGTRSTKLTFTPLKI